MRWKTYILLLLISLSAATSYAGEKRPDEDRSHGSNEASSESGPEAVPASETSEEKAKRLKKQASDLGLEGFETEGKEDALDEAEKSIADLKKDSDKKAEEVLNEMEEVFDSLGELNDEQKDAMLEKFTEGMDEDKKEELIEQFKLRSAEFEDLEKQANGTDDPNADPTSEEAKAKRRRATNELKRRAEKDSIARMFFNREDESKSAMGAGRALKLAEAVREGDAKTAARMLSSLTQEQREKVTTTLAMADRKSLTDEQFKDLSKLQRGLQATAIAKNERAGQLPADDKFAQSVKKEVSAGLDKTTQAVEAARTLNSADATEEERAEALKALRDQGYGTEQGLRNIGDFIAANGEGASDWLQAYSELSGRGGKGEVDLLVDSNVSTTLDTGDPKSAVGLSAGEPSRLTASTEAGKKALARSLQGQFDLNNLSPADSETQALHRELEANREIVANYEEAGSGPPPQSYKDAKAKVNEIESQLAKSKQRVPKEADLARTHRFTEEGATSVAAAAANQEISKIGSGLAARSHAASDDTTGPVANSGATDEKPAAKATDTTSNSRHSQDAGDKPSSARGVASASDDEPTLEEQHESDLNPAQRKLYTEWLDQVKAGIQANEEMSSRDKAVAIKLATDNLEEDFRNFFSNMNGKNLSDVDVTMFSMGTDGSQCPGCILGKKEADKLSVPVNYIYENDSRSTSVQNSLGIQVERFPHMVAIDRSTGQALVQAGWVSKSSASQVPRFSTTAVQFVQLMNTLNR